MFSKIKTFGNLQDFSYGEESFKSKKSFTKKKKTLKWLLQREKNCTNFIENQDFSNAKLFYVKLICFIFYGKLHA